MTGVFHLAMLTQQMARCSGKLSRPAVIAARMGTSRIPRVLRHDSAATQRRMMSESRESAPKPAEGAAVTKQAAEKTPETSAGQAQQLKTADSVPEAVGNFIFDNPGSIAGAFVVALVGWLIKSWADETQRTALEEAIDTERTVSGVEWTQLRESNRLSVGEFLAVARAALELFPEGTCRGDDFLWLVERVMADSRQQQMRAKAEAAAAQVHLKVSAMRESEQARRRAQKRQLEAQNAAVAAEAARLWWAGWASALTLGLAGERGGRSPAHAAGAPVGARGSWLSSGSAGTGSAGTGSAGDPFAGVYADETEAGGAFDAARGMQEVYDDLRSQQEVGTAAELEEEAAAETEVVDLEAWEAALPPLPDPDVAAEMALNSALRALPPTSLVHRQVLERLVRALETRELRGDAGVSEEGGVAAATPKPEGLTVPLLRLAQFLERSLRAEPPADQGADVAGPDRGARAVPTPLLLAALCNLVDESPEGRADALLALFSDCHPLLGGPGAGVALPEGYSALQVDYRRRARTLGFAGKLRGGVSGGVSAVAPDERAVADGVGAGEAAAEAKQAAQRGSLFEAEPDQLTDDAAELLAELEEAEAALPVSTEPRSSGYPGQEALPTRPALSPDAVRVDDVVGVVSALQATWQLVPGAVVEREQLVPYPRWRRRGGAAAVRSACERLSIKPAEVQTEAGGAAEVLSRADAMRLLWSNDVCAWGSCPAETGPLRPRPPSL